MGRPAIDLTGQQFGNLIVLERCGSSSDGHALWKCECQCENKTICYKTSNKLKRKNSFPSCGCKVTELISESAKKRFNNLLGQKFGMLIPIEKVGSTGNSILWRCHCNNCGNDNFITTAHHLTSGNTKSCGCLKSIGEALIQEILIENQILFIKEKNFSNLTYSNPKYSRPRYDFYLPELNRLIEYDGINHYKETNYIWDKQLSLKERQNRDKIKNQYAKEHGIPLVRIPYWERDNITLDMIMGDKYLIK